MEPELGIVDRGLVHVRGDVVRMCAAVGGGGGEGEEGGVGRGREGGLLSELAPRGVDELSDGEVLALEMQMVNVSRLKYVCGFERFDYPSSYNAEISYYG